MPLGWGSKALVVTQTAGIKRGPSILVPRVSDVPTRLAYRIEGTDIIAVTVAARIRIPAEDFMGNSFDESVRERDWARLTLAQPHLQLGLAARAGSLEFGTSMPAGPVPGVKTIPLIEL
jgi:hypothetical protein